MLCAVSLLSTSPRRLCSSNPSPCSCCSTSRKRRSASSERCSASRARSDASRTRSDSSRARYAASRARSSSSPACSPACLPARHSSPTRCSPPASWRDGSCISRLPTLSRSCSCRSPLKEALGMLGMLEPAVSSEPSGEKRTVSRSGGEPWRISRIKVASTASNFCASCRSAAA